MITFGEATDLASALLARAGMCPGDAAAAALAITTADAWGIGSHGLMRLPYYLERFAAGGMAADARLAVVRDTGPVLACDGRRGLGHPHVRAAVDLADERCERYGVAVVGVANSSHCGALGYYVLESARRGHVGLMFSNGPAVMAPWGGVTPVLSTSPIAAGIPAGSRPIIVDMATSAAARGAIAARAKRGDDIPDGWAVDVSGRPTTDAAAALAGMLAPLGGAKGYALALLVEALTGGIVGPALAGDVVDIFAAERSAEPQRISHLLIALDPSVLDVDGRSGERIATLAERVTAAGGRLPGERRRPPDQIDPAEPLNVSPLLVDELAAWQRVLAGDSA